MSYDEIRILKQRRDYFAQWINRQKQAQHIVPFVQSNIESTEWAIDALSKKPDDAGPIPSPGLAEQFREENDYIKQVIPMMPSYDVGTAIGSTAAATTAASDVYAFVTRIGDLDTPGAREYSDTYTKRYVDLQERQDRQSRTRELVSRLGNPKTLKRFDRASEAHAAWKAATGERTAAANEMRNLIYGIKGDLFCMAAKWQRENMTWQKMAERLARGGPGSPDAHQLLCLEPKHGRLVDLLSDPAKDREGQAAIDLKHVWIQVLDHVYALLTLTKLRTP